MRLVRTFWGLFLAWLIVACSPPHSVQKEGGNPLVNPPPQDKVLAVRLVDVIVEAIPTLYRLYPELFLNARLPFQTSLGPEGMLAVYDPTLQDVLLYPGAGRGIHAITEPLPDKFVFTRDGKAWVYDAQKEVVCLLHQPACGWVLEVFPDAFSNVFSLVAETPEQLEAGVGKVYRIPAAYPGFVPMLLSALAPASVALIGKPILPAPPFCPWPEMLDPQALCVINALGECHNGITSLRPTALGDVLAFITGDGEVYVYCLASASVAKIPMVLGKADYVTIDGLFGRYVAWEEVETHRIYVWDRVRECLDPVPFLNRLLEEPLVVAGIPFFYNVDPRHLYVLIVYGDGNTRLIAYDLISEEVLALTVLNNELCP